MQLCFGESIAPSGEAVWRTFFSRGQPTAPRAAATLGVAGQPADVQQASGVAQGRLAVHPLQSNSRSDGNQLIIEKWRACLRVSESLVVEVKTSLVQIDTIRKNAAVGVAMCK